MKIYIGTTEIKVLYLGDVKVTLPDEVNSSNGEN